MFTPELHALQFAVIFVRGRMDHARAAARDGDFGAVSLEMVVLVALLVAGAIVVAGILVTHARTRANEIVDH